MVTVLAFLVALALLIAVHEYGHYRMAVACGVKVLRFSIGFGKTLWRWQPQASGTEFVVAMIPLGGYVRMLDEREGEVKEEEKHLAFNRQSLKARAAIVAAGPLANLLLAVLLYATAGWIGSQEAAPILARPLPDSMAARAGLQGGEQVARLSAGEREPVAVRSYEALRWMLFRAALDAEPATLHLTVQPQSGRQRLIRLELGDLDVREADARLIRSIGLTGPLTRPVLGEILAQGAAARAGLLAGDLVLTVDEESMVDGAQLREKIRSATQITGEGVQQWRVQRQQQVLALLVTPDLVAEGDRKVGKIGAYVGAPPQRVEVRYGLVEGLVHGVERTVDLSLLTLRMMARMITGEASWKNLSGPLTIADYAGKSAQVGLVPYLVFLALISVSLGVLNLLPLPMLDGGHLMYYLWEALTGRAVNDVWMERMQRGGVVLLVLLLSVALFNDVTRLFWG